MVKRYKNVEERHQRNQKNVKALVKSLENKPLTPRIHARGRQALYPLLQLHWKRIHLFYFSFTLRISSIFDLMLSTCVSDKEKGDLFSEEIAE
jgi:hypothetical protein